MLFQPHTPTSCTHSHFSCVYNILSLHTAKVSIPLYFPGLSQPPLPQQSLPLSACLALVPEERRHAKVGDLEVVVLIQQQVLWLEVAVGDAAAVQILLKGGEEGVGVSGCIANTHTYFFNFMRNTKWGLGGKNNTDQPCLSTSKEAAQGQYNKNK